MYIRANAEFDWVLHSKTYEAILPIKHIALSIVKLKKCTYTYVIIYDQSIGFYISIVRLLAIDTLLWQGNLDVFSSTCRQWAKSLLQITFQNQLEIIYTQQIY